MDNFKIQLNSDKNTIALRYYDLVNYRTLLKSLEELIDINMMERVTVVLDFSEVKTLLLGYRQIINFRLGLNNLLAKKTINRIAILKPAETSLINTICSCTQLVENDFMKADLRCFGFDSRVAAYHWISSISL